MMQTLNKILLLIEMVMLSIIGDAKLHLIAFKVSSLTVYPIFFLHFNKIRGKVSV